MLDLYQTLEIKNVLNDIASFCKSQIAKDKILNLRMISNVNDVANELKIVDEMMSCLLRHNALPLSNSFALSSLVDKAQKDGILEINDLEQIANDILLSKDLFAYFKKVEIKLYPCLIDLANKLFNLLPLEKEIHRIITPNLTIYDNASDKLFIIRKKITKLENSSREIALSQVSKYQDYLSDKSISFRSDHYVLAVKSSFKNKVPGIIHDVSTSGQTTFIEPNVLVELANELYLAKKEENEEIICLLKDLSSKVKEHGGEIKNNNDIIARFDFINAKAIYGNIHNAFVARLADKPLINIVGARHPLIDINKVVPNDFYLDENQRLIIISGPNAGGKTVALKTLGLMIMMNQMGMAIPSKETATLSYFPKIYADIGDNQSLSDNLSTFAAHVSNLSTISHFVTRSDLVLLDELGTGTSPSEGEAIALAISDFLLSKQCFGVISSHFEGMKQYAFAHEKVCNAMMIFDEKKLIPTYSLKIGYPGRSYGLEMAKRYHLKDCIINKASKYLNNSKHNSINDVIDRLNNVLRENETINEQLKVDKKQLSIKENQLNNDRRIIDKKKQSLLEDVKHQKEKMLLEAEEKITNILREISSPNAKQKDYLLAREKLFALEDKKEEVILDKPYVIKVNDIVETIDSHIGGKVTSINGNKATLIIADNLSATVNINKLIPSTIDIPNSIKKTTFDEEIFAKHNVKSELNIIGLHVNEGIEKVQRYLSDVLLSNYKEVRIIHGMGTGALREAVHSYLATCTFVKEYHYAGYYDGGTGATIVSLK